jgi:hypothetical protein
MITTKEYFSRNNKPIPATDVVPEHVLNNLWVSLEKQNGNIPLIVSSVYRTKEINATIKKSDKRSNHVLIFEKNRKYRK